MSLVKHSDSDDEHGAKRRKVEGGGFGSGPSGFSQASTQLMSAQVAAARESTDQLLRNMKGVPGEAPVDTAGSHRLAQEMQTSLTVSVNKKLVEYLMTPEHRLILAEESGAEVEFVPQAAKVKLVGSAKAVSLAKRFVGRVELHCHWGANLSKVGRLLRRSLRVQSVLVRLSPMTVNVLQPSEKMFNQKDTTMSIGKDRQNTVVIQEQVMSRQHCMISFDAAKGIVYIADLSTNGTWVNGVRLPSKKLGKIMLSHGDELLFKDPGSGDTEFGYICNLKEVSVREDVKLVAPRRLVSPEEMSVAKGHLRDSQL